MNRLRKIYCRAYQTIFKLAMPFLPYRTPEILKDSSEAADVLKDKCIGNVLIVTDSFIHDSGLLEPMKHALDCEGIRYTVFDKAVSNPTIAIVEQAREAYISNSCSALIGFGGGSSIDTAKAVGARIAKPKKTIQQMKGILKIIKKTPFMIAVPTTAGTGSEVTVTTVITDEKTHHKFPISDFPLIPNVAVLDPKLSLNLPKGLTATTGMDALTHAVEAYIGRSTTKSTRSDALEAVRLITQNLEKAYKNGYDIIARENMLQGAFLAGRAFSQSYVGYCHAVSHSLGGKYNVPHGLANAVLLPYTLEAYGDCIHSKLKQLAIAAGIADETTPDSVAASLFIRKVREMNQSMDIPTKISGIKESDIPELAEYAAKEANPLYPVPVLMDAERLQKFYYDVMEESLWELLSA